jgi:hypothetical protein
MIRRNGKMTLTFNPDKYKELLSQYQPKIIRNEADNEKALAMVEELMHRRDRTPEEDELYELLIALIEKFEQEYLCTRNHSNASFNIAVFDGTKRVTSCGFGGSYWV